MSVFGRANDDGVNVFKVFDKPTKIDLFPSFGESFRDTIERCAIDITDSGDFHARIFDHLLQVSGTSTTDAYKGEAKLVVG
jgi:hypothetical protein